MNDHVVTETDHVGASSDVWWLLSQIGKSGLCFSFAIFDLASVIVFFNFFALFLGERGNLFEDIRKRADVNNAKRRDKRGSTRTEDFPEALRDLLLYSGRRLTPNWVR